MNGLFRVQEFRQDDDHTFVMESQLKEEIADVISIGIMKMETMMRRSKFRDYYDIYSILINGADIMTMIPAALEHSGYKLKTKNLLAMLTNGELFQKDEGFEQLSPVYDVSAYDIQEYLKSLIEKSKE